jgi:hypothetical protein
MKAGRRKDLKTNELIQSIQEVVQTVRRYGGYIAVGAVAAVLVIVIGFYWRYSEQQRRQQAWEQVLMAAQGAGAAPVDRVQRLQQVAADHEGENVGAMADLLLARILLNEATFGPAAEDPSRREDLLGRAERAFRLVVEKYPDKLVPLGAALMGLAHLAEQQRDWQQAQSRYQQILADERLEVTPYWTLAARDLEEWSRLSTQKVVFVEATPATQPATSSQPVATTRSSRPSPVLPAGD